MYQRPICLVILVALGLTAIPRTTHAQVENLVLNHSFEEDEDFQAGDQWRTWAAADGQASAIAVVETEAIDGVRSLRVDPIGTFYVVYSPLSLEIDTEYTASFWARAEEARPLGITPKANDNSVSAGGTSLELTTEWAEYTITFDAPAAVLKFDVACGGSDVRFYLDFFQIYEGPYVDGIAPSGKQVQVMAVNPDPAGGQTDVPYDTDLSWTPGVFAETHDVYFGTVRDDVNDASRGNPLDVLVSQGQTATTYDPPGLLELSQTYYWRVDEVNAAPDGTIFKGGVWSFTAEPRAYPIQNVLATSNAISEGTEGPENTINGSGLNALDQHSIEATDMWLGVPTGADPIYLQYEFDRVYQLLEMQVWNYNVQFELILGFGLKDVTVEYSENGTDWTVLGDVEFAQAPATADYSANTVVEFNSMAARFVRVTINSGWGLLSQYGLSEVRFMAIPAQAREPEPADGATGVTMDATLAWRGGRDALAHEVYFGTDSEALPLADTVAAASYDPGALDLGTTYTWKIDEVLDAKTWEGPVWSFATREYLVIDDMESYDDEDNVIYESWIDGWVNETGSTVGYLEASFAETRIVNGGGQSMPLEYANDAAPFYAEAERDIGGADWTAGAADTLRLYVYGGADNSPETLYVAIADLAGNVAVATHPDGAVLTTEAWQEWAIPYSALSGVDLGRVATLYIGIGDRDNPSAGGGGLIFIDDLAFGNPAAVQ